MNQDLYTRHINRIQRSAQRLQPISTRLESTNSRLTGSEIKAVLFDIYGTLFISASGDISLADKQADAASRDTALAQEFNVGVPPQGFAAAFRNEVHTIHAMMKSRGITFPEIRVEEIWASVLGVDLDKNRETIEEFALAWELLVNPVYPMPGAASLLYKLKTANYRMGIISNAQFYTPLLFDALLETEVDKAGFDPDLCFYSYLAGRGKPDSFMYEAAKSVLEKKYQILPKETLYVGNDMRNDISAAQRSGFRTVLFAGDKRSLRLREGDPFCEGIEPDAVITDLMDLTNSLF